MSRYELPTKDGFECVVGWDPPLSTFFAQVWDRTKDEDDPASEILWVGWNHHEINDIQKLMDLVEPWAKFPDEVKRALYRDAD